MCINVIIFLCQTENWVPVYTSLNEWLDNVPKKTTCYQKFIECALILDIMFFLLKDIDSFGRFYTLKKLINIISNLCTLWSKHSVVCPYVLNDCTFIVSACITCPCIVLKEIEKHSFHKHHFKSTCIFFLANPLMQHFHCSGCHWTQWEYTDRNQCRHKELVH